jgi:hypothetical protein
MGLEPSIYLIRGEHANNYTTHAVSSNPKQNQAINIILTMTYITIITLIYKS